MLDISKTGAHVWVHVFLVIGITNIDIIVSDPERQA